MPHLITVLDSGAFRKGHGPLGFGRIELQVARNPNADYLETLRENRALTAAVYRVAAELEGIGGAEGCEFSVSTAKARLGIIDVDFRSDAFNVYVIDEMLIEACANCGFAPDQDPRCDGGPAPKVVGS